MSNTVLILGGSGKIGSHAAIAFENAGWTVRHFNRKTEDMIAAAMGADVIVNGLNPANYHDWTNTIPAITTQVVAAAQASGATVILPGNVYNFGLITGEMNETSPQNPNTVKGKIRVDLEETYRTAGIQTIVLRAGAFIDPNGNGDMMSMMTMRSKRKLTYTGDPNAMQAYAYVPDWARAAVLLAEMREELDTFEDIPFPGHTFSINQLKDRIETITGVPHKLTAFPWWIMTMLSPFVEVARELSEMRYLFGMSHWLGADKFNRLLPDFQATSMDDVMTAGLSADIYPNQTMRTRRQAIAAE